MTAGARASPVHGAATAVWLLGGLAAASLARAALNGQVALSAFVAGATFGIVLVAMATMAGWRPARPSVSSLLIGSFGGLVLVALPRLAHPLLPAVIGMRPEPFAAWALVTAVVVTGEEALVRGALFGTLERAAGPVAAVAVTSLAFALMHVPLYGWHVVPLDLGVGVWLAGLRLATGGVAAPAIAHGLADLSTWWI
jgi:membrane protease YdiL (CAAX protease family)